MGEASFGAWPNASSDCCSYLSTPVASQLCDAHAVRLIELRDHHVRGVNWDCLFLVIGLAGLDSFNVQTTLFSVDSQDCTREWVVAALSTMALSTMGLIAASDLDDVANSNRHGPDASKSIIGLAQLEASSHALALLVRGVASAKAQS